MRLALMTAALASLAACGGEPEADGPERSSAAGEVLGGEVTDDMLPLDTVRSTSPADPRAGEPGEPGEPGAEVSPSAGASAGSPDPRAILTEAPMPDMTMPADPEPLRTPQ